MIWGTPILGTPLFYHIEISLDLTNITMVISWELVGLTIKRVTIGGAPVNEIAKLVNKTSISVWFMVLVTSSHGVKLNNKKTGVPHIVGI